MNALTQLKKISILPLFIALALVALASPPVTRADAVTDWNLIASTTIVVNGGQPPPVSVLSFAMVQGAVYDAVNAIDRGHRPYLVQPNANPTDSKEAAASTAAFRVLVGFPDLPRLVPGAAADVATAVRCLHSEPARRPTGIEGCGDRYR